jgi:N-methylhydantoinase A
MASAIEKVSLGRGYDPRDFTVIGYGGGSGLFLAEVCRELGIGRLVMPRAAATFSAYGLLFADALRSASTTAQWIVDHAPVEAINAIYESLQKRAVSALRHEGFSDGDIVVRREADLKFAGQSFEISMAWPQEPVSEAQRASLGEAFLAEYERVYGAGSAWDGFPVELHTARVVASGTTPKPPIATAEPGASSGAIVAAGAREIRLGDETLQAATYDGVALSAGSVIGGPAVIDDVDTTLLVPPGAQLQIDRLGNYVFTVDVAGSHTSHDTVENVAVAGASV